MFVFLYSIFKDDARDDDCLRISPSFRAVSQEIICAVSADPADLLCSDVPGLRGENIKISWVPF